MRPPKRMLDRRRFLVLSGSVALVATSCGRLLDDGQAAQPGEDGASPAHGEATPDRDTDPTPDTSGEATRPPDPDAEAAPDPDTTPDPDTGTAPDADAGTRDPIDPADAIDPELARRTPQEWGQRVTGARTRIDTEQRLVALTFDGCGGPGGSGADTALLDHLEDLAVPATLFLNARWIEANRALTRELARDPRYELANHGTEHRPLSVTGKSAYGIRGTRSADEVVEEVLTCQALLEDLTGDAPRHFRPGTAYADEVAVAIVDQLGLEVVNFDVLGDAGATFSAAEVERSLLGAGAGSIALLHMNHPGSGTAAGVAAAVPQLRDRGFTFTTLGDHPLA